MMEEQGLLAAIAEAPDDDAPRLVYADWLLGRGDPRGELIQLQCRLAATPDDERRRAMRVVENKLLDAHADTWTAPLRAALPAPLPGHLDPTRFTFVRGFVEEARLGLDALPHLAALIERAPLLRGLELVPAPPGSLFVKAPRPRLGDALGSAVFARLRSLALVLPGGGDELAFAVAEAAMLRQLRTLRIGASVWGEQAMYFQGTEAELVLGDAGAVALAGSPHLAGLEHLDLASNRIGVPGLHAIARGAWRLRSLVLSHNALALSPAEDRSPLADALAGPALATLESLGLDAIPLSPHDVTALVASPTLAQLRELDLERCQIGAAGVAALCEAFALPALRRLRLERNNLCDAGARAIAGCAALSQLTSLEAGHNRIGQKGGTALATSPHLRNLERLLLNEPRWKPEMREVFVSSPTLANAKIYLAGRLLARKPARTSAPSKRKRTPDGE
jgi:uncharacterized protein (TIGR02996 family)